VWLEKQGSTWTAYYGYGNALYRRNSEYPLYDGHGSERTVTDASQNVTGTLNLDAFGNLAGSTGSSSNPYMYCGAFGYRNDADAGLALVGARYYDYQVGRFVTRDTYLDQHPYLYCGHDPVNAVDPIGHDYITLSFDISIILPGWGSSVSVGISIGEGGIGVSAYYLDGPGYGTPAWGIGPSLGWSPGSIKSEEGWTVGTVGVLGVGWGCSATAKIGPGGTGVSIGGPGTGGGTFGGGGFGRMWKICDLPQLSRDPGVGGVYHDPSTGTTRLYGPPSY
jgi:RHS repeat-associated protein